MVESMSFGSKFTNSINLFVKSSMVSSELSICSLSDFLLTEGCEGGVPGGVCGDGGPDGVAGEVFGLSGELYRVKGGRLSRLGKTGAALGGVRGEGAFLKLLLVVLTMLMLYMSEGKVVNLLCCGMGTAEY